MWLINDSTQGFFLEYWIMPEKKCVVSMKADSLKSMEALVVILNALKVEPR